MAKVSNPEVNVLLAMVEERTGYPVHLDRDKDLSTYSDVRVATPKFPHHLIQVKPDMAAYAEYLVAAQCFMILAKWTDRGPTPAFIVRDSKFNLFTQKIKKSPQIKRIPADSVERYVTFIAQGVIRQLSSLPIEMIANEQCWQQCQSLRHQQVEIVRRNLRDMTGVLAPNVRDSAPKIIYEKSVMMGAAFALWWEKSSGDTVSAIPFRVLGYADNGQKLMDAYLAVPPDDSMRAIKITDAWASILGMATIYEWLPSKESN